MKNLPFVAPEVIAVDVTKCEPDSRVHRVMIDGVDAGDGWGIASERDPRQRVKIGEVGSQNLLIAEDIFPHPFPRVRDRQLLVLLVHCESIGIRPEIPARTREQQDNANEAWMGELRRHL